MAKYIEKAFLLSAGIGSRLRPHTKKIAKPRLPFLGVPLLDFGFYLLQDAGFSNFLFNYHHAPESILPNIEKLNKHCETQSLFDETKRLLGSGGAIANAKEQLKDNDWFLIANGDELLIPTKKDIIHNLINQFIDDKALCTLLVCDHPDLFTVLSPAWIDAKGHIMGFGKEKPNQDCSPVHYTGYKVFSKRILDYLPEGESNIFYPVLLDAIKSGETVTTYFTKDLLWYETGNFQSFIEATKKCIDLYEDSKYLQNLFSFYQMEPMTVIKDGENRLFKPKSLTLPIDFKWSGVVCISSNCSIKSNVTAHNTIFDSFIKTIEPKTYKDEFVFLKQ